MNTECPFAASLKASLFYIHCCRYTEGMERPATTLTDRSSATVTPGRSAVRADQRPAVCHRGLCQNGGTCRQVPQPDRAVPSCDCPLHFTGRFCEKGRRLGFILPNESFHFHFSLKPLLATTAATTTTSSFFFFGACESWDHEMAWKWEHWSGQDSLAVKELDSLPTWMVSKLGFQMSTDYPWASSSTMPHPYLTPLKWEWTFVARYPVSMSHVVHPLKACYYLFHLWTSSPRLPATARHVLSDDDGVSTPTRLTFWLIISEHGGSAALRPPRAYI